MEVGAATVVGYSESLLAWRDQLWPLIPLCEEAFHAGELMDVTASYFVATFALELAGAPVYTDPFVESASAAQTEQELLDLLSDPPPARGATSEAYVLPLCTDTELDILKTILAEFFALQEIPPRTETSGGLAQYGEAQAVWRDSIASRLPFCRRSYESGLLMRHIASDIAIELAFNLADLSAMAGGISERIAADRAKLAALTEDMADDARDLVASQSFATALPACSEAEKFGYVALAMTHPELLGSIAEADTTASLLDAARAHIAWRAEQDESLPACAENLEIFWILYRAVGAFFTGHTLETLGLPREDNGHIQLVMRLDERRSHKTLAITHAFADAVAERIENDEVKTRKRRRRIAACQPARRSSWAWASSMPSSNMGTWLNGLTPWKTWAMFWSFSKRRSPGPIAILTRFRHVPKRWKSRS